MFAHFAYITILEMNRKQEYHNDQNKDHNKDSENGIHENKENVYDAINLNFTIRGEIFIIPPYVIDRIPFLKILFLKNKIHKQTDPNGGINDLEMISPKFLRIIIDFLHNSQSINHLKKLLDEFDEKV